MQVIYPDGRSQHVCSCCKKPKAEGEYANPRSPRYRQWVCRDCSDRVLAETLAVNEELYANEPDAQFLYWPAYFASFTTDRFHRELMNALLALRPKRPRLVGVR